MCISIEAPVDICSTSVCAVLHNIDWLLKKQLRESGVGLFGLTDSLSPETAFRVGPKRLLQCFT